MKKKYLVLGVMALGFMAYHWWPRSTQPVMKVPQLSNIQKPRPVANHAQTVVQIPKAAPMIPTLRGPASVTRGPAPLPFDVEKENSLSVGKNWKLMLDISVVDKKKYRPELGKKLLEDKHFTFFRSPVTHKETWPVAYDPSRRQLFPVSHILHIKGVDENERLQFRAEGMTEYYYHARIQYLSVQSTPTQVVKDYQILKERGFDVRMEVLKEGVKPN